MQSREGGTSSGIGCRSVRGFDWDRLYPCLDGETTSAFNAILSCRVAMQGCVLAVAALHCIALLYSQ